MFEFEFELIRLPTTKHASYMHDHEATTHQHIKLTGLCPVVPSRTTVPVLSTCPQSISSHHRSQWTSRFPLLVWFKTSPPHTVCSAAAHRLLGVLSDRTGDRRKLKPSQTLRPGEHVAPMPTLSYASSDGPMIDDEHPIPR